MKVFISHTHADKPVVEPIALRLKDIFGQDEVFYDSWSISPGDSIVDKISKGMEEPEFVFFFISSGALNSGMVSSEWQTALYKATKGECKIIPVRLDQSPLPEILRQNLYIDLYSHGLEAAIVQIVNVVQGNNAFIPQHSDFSNLTYSLRGNGSDRVIVKIVASHYIEPNPAFVILTPTSEEMFSAKLNGGAPFSHGFSKNVTVGGRRTNAFAISPLGGAVTPKISMTIELEATAPGRTISVQGVMHKISDNEYSTIPEK